MLFLKEQQEQKSQRATEQKSVRAKERKSEFPTLNKLGLHTELNFGFGVLKQFGTTNRVPIFLKTHSTLLRSSVHYVLKVRISQWDTNKCVCIGCFMPP